MHNPALKKLNSRTIAFFGCSHMKMNSLVSTVEDINEMASEISDKIDYVVDAIE